MSERGYYTDVDPSDPDLSPSSARTNGQPRVGTYQPSGSVRGPAYGNPNNLNPNPNAIRVGGSVSLARPGVVGPTHLGQPPVSANAISPRGQDARAPGQPVYPTRGTLPGLPNPNPAVPAPSPGTPSSLNPRPPNGTNPPSGQPPIYPTNPNVPTVVRAPVTRGTANYPNPQSQPVRGTTVDPRQPPAYLDSNRPVVDPRVGGRLSISVAGGDTNLAPGSPDPNRSLAVSGGSKMPRSSSSPRHQQILASKQRTPGERSPTQVDFNPLNTTVLPKVKKPAQIVKFDPRDITRDKPKLAKGSFGIIYTGHVKGIKEKVVIKDMTNVYPESVEEWKNEIEVMTNNSCDFVCKIFGHCEDGETLSLIVEYMPKGDLFGILHKNPQQHPLSILQRMRMARQTAYGLTFLHSNGLMHRDMKSLNILVTDDYSCKLADFGTAKLVTQAQALNTANVGSPLWMAPEVRNGVYGFPADVYSLGLILYEIFSGKMPIFNPTTMTTSLPAQFSYSKLILPCIDRDPTKRPTSFQIGQMLDTMISSIVVSVLNSIKQPGSKPPENPVDKLCSAAWNNDVATVRQLLNAGNINDKNARGQCPLYCAARQGSVDVVLELLNFGGIQVDQQVPEHGGTPLHAASYADQCEVVALLLAKGATSSIANLKGLTARQEAKSKAQEVYYVFEKSGLEKLKQAFPVVLKLNGFQREAHIHKPLPREGVPFPELADLEGPQRLEVIYKYILSLPPAEAEALINNAFKTQMFAAK